MNPVIERMASHRTIRKFKPVPLSKDTVQRAVRAAQMAATSSHLQAYSLIWVTDPSEREKLAELCGGQPQVANAGAFFVIAADQRRHRLLAERAGRRYEPNFETFLLATIDASLFAQNLVLAFESQNLGTCYIGGLRNGLPGVDELLELPSDVFPLYGLCAGEPDDDPGPRPRLPIEAVLLQERYPTDECMLAAIGTFDDEMRRYYEGRGKPGYDWSGGVTRRFETLQRADVFEYYRAKGAEFS